MSWKLCTTGTKADIEAALDARDTLPDWNEDIVLTGYEIAPDNPDLWQLDAYLAGRPNAAVRKAVRSLFIHKAPRISAEKLPDTDWVTLSQQGVEPIRAGRFYVHTPDFAPSPDPDAVNFCIPAAQAFGTGQHETTSGCLAMLDEMSRLGLVPRNIADIGTGTGLLAFAASALWPRARFTASDNDPLCMPAVNDNAARNHIALGTSSGQLAMYIAEGMDDEDLQTRAPYDLLIANILAGPLIDLAPDFAACMAPRGNILLSGLLTVQEKAVRAAYRKQGYRLQQRLVSGDWSILWLRHRYKG